MVFKLKQLIRDSPILHQRIRNIIMSFVHFRLGLKFVDRTFYIHTPTYYISKDFVAGKYGLVGYNSYICPNVEFGNYVLIAPNVSIIGGDHTFHIPGVPIIFSERPLTPKTVIEDDVWVGRGATILAGTRIGRGSIIAAGSVVTRDVDEYTIVGGVPAKFIKFRFSGEKEKENHDLFLKSSVVLKKYPGNKIK